MKSRLLNLTLVLMLFLSCKKEHTIGTPIVNPNSTTYTVSFKAGFTQTSSTFAVGKQLNSIASASIDTNVVNNMVFVVYDSVGHVVQVIKQTTADTLFGSAKFNLRSGKYTAIIAGCGGINPLQYNYSTEASNGPSNLNTDEIDIYQSYNGFDPNTFYKKVTFTVGNTPINQSVSLDRIVSRLTVVIQGGFPKQTPSSGYYSAKAVIISGVANRYYVGSSSPGPGLVYDPNHYNIVNLSPPPVTNTALYGAGNYVLTALVLASSSPIVVDITGYSTNYPVTNLVAERKVSVTCIPNTETILTGDLFGTTGTTGGSSVNVNTTWKSEVITKSFGN